MILAQRYHPIDCACRVCGPHKAASRDRLRLKVALIGFAFVVSWLVGGLVLEATR